MKTTNELTTQLTQLPDTIEDLTQFVLVSKAKLQAYMLKLQTVSKLSVAQEIRDQTLKEAQEVSTALIAAEQRIGELLLAIPKQAGGVNQYNKEEKSTRVEKSKSEVISDMGYSKDEASDYQRMAQNPDVVQRVIDNAVANGDVVTKTAVMKEIKALRDEIDDRDKKIKQLIDNPTVEIRTPADYYDVKQKLRSVSADLENERAKRDQDLRRNTELKEEIEKLKQATKEGLDTENLSENVYYFCTLANNFIGNVGGLVWLTDRIADMPAKEKDLFLKAAYSFRDWASAFTANLERRTQ